MKYLILLMLLILWLPVIVNAQSPSSFVDLYDSSTSIKDVFDHMSSIANDTFEGGPASKYMTLRHFWSGRVLHNDADADEANNVNMFTKYFNTLHNAIIARQSESCGEGFHGNWECIGPLELELQHMGRIDALWVDPDDEDYILAGTIGGLLKRQTEGTIGNVLLITQC